MLLLIVYLFKRVWLFCRLKNWVFFELLVVGKA